MRSTRCRRWGPWWGEPCTGECTPPLQPLQLPVTRQGRLPLSSPSLSAAGCSGICREGDGLVVGPTDSGQFHQLTVGSIQRNRSACRVLRAGQAATLALGDFDRSLLRKVRTLLTAFLFFPSLQTEHMVLMVCFLLPRAW